MHADINLGKLKVTVNISVGTFSYVIGLWNLLSQWIDEFSRFLATVSLTCKRWGPTAVVLFTKNFTKNNFSISLASGNGHFIGKL